MLPCISIKLYKIKVFWRFMMKRIFPLFLLIIFTFGYFSCKSKKEKPWEGSYERIYGSVRLIFVLKSHTWYQVKITSKRDVNKKPNAKIIDKGENVLKLVSDDKAGQFRVKYTKDYIDVWWQSNGKEQSPNRYRKINMLFSY